MSSFTPRALFGALFVAALFAVGHAIAQDAERPLVSPAVEARIAAQQHPQILQRFGGEYQDRQLALYIEEVGRRLVRAHGAQGFRFQFWVVDSPDAFAFTQTGGYVYISRSMLALANSEDELAAVLAHEIAHVFARHGAERQARKLELEPGEADTIDLLKAFTRDQELEADALSIPILLAAGYDPFAQGHFLTVMRRYDTVSIESGIRQEREEGDKTHPELVERAAAANDLAQELFAELAAPASPAGEFPGPAYLEFDSEEEDVAFVGDPFFDAIDGVVFGHRPTDGMVVGNTYVNVRARYTFDLPPGFRFTYTGRTILAEGPGGATMRFDSYTNRRTFNSDLIAFLARNTSFRIEEDSAHRLEINGLPGALARAELRSQEGNAEMYLGVVQVTSRTLYRFSFWIPIETPAAMAERAWSAPLSFRRVTVQEARAWQPLRLDIVTVRPGMTPESLAAQMRMLDDPMAWFWMLNDLEPGEELVPGQRVKIVTQH